MTDAAPVADAAPAPNAVPSTAPTPPTTVIAGAPKAQPPAQEPTEAERAAKRAANIERHNKILENEQRNRSKLKIEADRLAAEKATRAEDLALAAEARRLKALAAADPIKFLEDPAVGLKLGELNKLYLKQHSGKTTEQTAEETVTRLLAQRDEAAKAEAAKAAEKAASEQAARSAKARDDTYANARKQIGDIIAADDSAFEELGVLGDPAVDLVWRAMEKFFTANGNKIEGLPTFKEAAAGVEHQLREKRKARDAARKAAAEAAKKPSDAKAAPAGAKSVTKSGTPDDVKPPSPPTPTKGRLQPIMDYRAVARQLLFEQAAKKAASQDT